MLTNENVSGAVECALAQVEAILREEVRLLVCARAVSKKSVWM
jgi:hypothetical protein